jgi:predicted Zn-dependent protease
MKYGRDDELESDEWGIQLMVEAGYDPRALIGVMQILEKASGGSRQPEFASTHPSPENRIGRIEQNIKNAYPNGLPTNLRK